MELGERAQTLDTLLHARFCAQNDGGRGESVRGWIGGGVGGDVYAETLNRTTFHCTHAGRRTTHTTRGAGALDRRKTP